MPKEYLNAEQLQRSDQLYFTHKALSTVQDAAKEAMKQYDKYLEAMDKVVSALLDNSDCVEETRKLFGPRGEQQLAPTFEVTGRLSDAFAAWKASGAVKKMRADLEALGDLSGTAKRSVKLAEKSSSDLEKAAQKAAKYNTDKMERKIDKGRSSRQKRLKEQQDEANAQVQVMDNAVIESMLSLGKWWSGKLVALTDGLYESYADIGTAIISIFPHLPSGSRPSPEVLRSPPPALQSHQNTRSAESSRATSQHHRASGNTDLTGQSSPSAPSSSVNARSPQAAEAGGPFPPTRAATTAAGADALAGSAPPPLFAMAAARHRDVADPAMPDSAPPNTNHSNNRSGGSSLAHAAPLQMAGAPLLFQPPPRQDHRCKAE